MTKSSGKCHVSSSGSVHLKGNICTVVFIIFIIRRSVFLSPLCGSQGCLTLDLFPYFEEKASRGSDDCPLHTTAINMRSIHNLLVALMLLMATELIRD